MTGVVVGVEGTIAAARALDRAALEARRTGRALTVVRAWQRPVWVGASMGQVYDYDVFASAVSSEETAREEAAELVAKASDVPPDVRLVVEEGPAGSVLVDASEDADLLVVGSHPRRPLLSRVLGSTASHVVHHAHCAVMVVPAEGVAASPYQQVVVGVDGSPASLAALRWAATRAHDEGCPLVALHVHQFGRLPRDVVAEIADTRAWLLDLVGRELGTDTVACEVLAGSPSEQVLNTVQEDDLLVLGARGEGGFAGLHLGSVADQCTRHAPCVVAIVRAESA